MLDTLVFEIDERVQASVGKMINPKQGFADCVPQDPTGSHRVLEYCWRGGQRLEDLICILVWPVFFGERVVLHREGKNTPAQ